MNAKWTGAQLSREEELNNSVAVDIYLIYILSTPHTVISKPVKHKYNVPTGNETTNTTSGLLLNRDDWIVDT